MSRKVKHFFGKKETTTVSFDKLKKELYNLNIETLKDLSAENSLNHRLKGLNNLYDIVLTKKLEKYAVEAVCKSIEDMLDPQNSIETRHTVFQFYCALIVGQDYMDTMRSYLFRILMQHKIQDDILPRLEMLKALTDCGKNISYFEEEIGPFLLGWFPDIITTDKTADFLALITNLIKFNAAYLDDNIICGCINYTCILCSKTKQEEDIEACLNVLEAVLCYSHLPDYALQSFIYTLCLTVNIEKYSPCSWKQMKNLLGTNVGHTCIFFLCNILQEKNNYSHSALLRGAVFFIGMALWGSNKIATLIHPPTAVLPSFLKALESKDSIIAYEIILSLQRLVKSDDELQSVCWNIIFDIVEKVLEFSELQDNNESVLAKAVHDLISAAEDKASDWSYERLHKIIEQCSSSRNEKSVIKLITYIVEIMNPFRTDFLMYLQKILEKYFRNEKRPAIQLEALKAISQIRDNCAHLFEDDYLDQIILQHMSQLDSVSDVQVRKAAVEILVDMGCSCTGNWFVEILDILEKVLKLSFDTLSSLPKDNLNTYDSFVDVLVSVQGLIKIFKKKIYMPMNHYVAIYSCLNSYMNKQYSELSYNSEISNIRKLILEFLLDFRANSRKQLGIIMDNNIEYSVYVSCDFISKESGGSVPPSPGPGSPPVSGIPTFSYLCYDSAFQVIISSLKEDRDWAILEMIFRKLPKLLQNKSLILQGNCSLSALCSTLCRMVSDRTMGRPDSLKNAPPRLTRTDIQGHIYPCVSALTSYHANLESYMQRTLIRCLQSGLVSRSAKVCIEGLMICSLEMQNSMVKLLPDVLLKLSKISATVGVAVAVLEFLSNLIRLPPLYISFVEDQYMSIFAIALPYTNPFKFNQYIVALAHHVIAMWFLKCRIPFRKDFAKFISKGLSSNIHVPCEETESSSHHHEDSSQVSAEKSNKMSNNAIISLHTELMETGLDLMARFTFGMASNVPKRSPVSEFLLEKGQKTSWLVGNRIVTITTSGCSTKPFKNGLCERCSNLCMDFKNSDPHEKDSIFLEDESVREEPSSSRKKDERKRHRSAIQRRTTTLSRELKSDSNQTQDDFFLHFRRLHSVDSAVRDEAEVQEGGFSFLKSDKGNNDQQSHLCTCWCTNWAEVHIRRPTGNTSWLMKIQNQLCLPSSPPDVPLSLLTAMVLQGPWGQGPDSSLLFPMHEDLEDEPYEVPTSAAVDIISYSKTEPPMRRTNSSPDVNTLWMDSCSSDAEHIKRGSHLPDSNESDTESFIHGSTEYDNAQLSSRNVVQEERKSSLRLDLSTESKTSSNFDFGQRGSEDSEKVMFRKGLSVGPFRDRGHTISVMSPIHPKVVENPNQKLETNRRSGMNPSFVFLQLYHNSCLGPSFHKPLLLLQTEANVRALNVLDHIPPYDTHKIGVVYVGEGQATDEVAILSNIYGSARYVNFIKKLGNLVRLTDVDAHSTYLGGLDTRGEDGKFALIWHDDVMQIVFHVATFMVNKEKDPMRNEKKKHIANDCVIIVYNESGEDYSLSTIKGHVTNACVIITPEDFNSNIVSVKLKTKELSDMFDHSESYMISDYNLPVFVRQLALHANLASLIISRQQQSMKYLHVSNWLERLRTIKRLRSKVQEELKNSNDSFESSIDSSNFDNFTDYV